MKRIIRAASDNAAILEERFAETISEAYDVGYNLTIDGNVDMTLEARSSTDRKYLPEIEVETVEDDGVYYFSPKLTFPELDFEDMEYYDSIQYWLDKWAKIGKFISTLTSLHYDPNEWEEE